MTTFIEGDTSQRVFTLTQNGAVVDLTTATVEVVLRPHSNAHVAFIYPAVIVDAANGKVGVSLTPDQLKASESPYSARLKVTDSGIVSYFPFPEPDSWEVVV